MTGPAIKVKISGSGTVGLTPQVANAVRFQAGKSPAVQAIDAAITARRESHIAAVAAYEADIARLKAERAAAVEAVVAPLVAALGG